MMTARICILERKADGLRITFDYFGHQLQERMEMQERLLQGIRGRVSQAQQELAGIDLELAQKKLDAEVDAKRIVREAQETAVHIVATAQQEVLDMKQQVADKAKKEALVLSKEPLEEALLVDLTQE